MRKVVWSVRTLDDFDNQINHIALESPRSAELVAGRVERLVATLEELHGGRPGRVSGTFEKYIPHTSLVLAYMIDKDDNLAILRIIHASRNWPDGEWPEE